MDDAAEPRFTPRSPVLCFPEHQHQALQARRRQYVLWPALAYRVVAPLPSQRQVNLFQRAALWLCRSGCVRAQDIARHLGIEGDLGALIMTELQGAGWVDHRGAVTPTGLRALESAEHEQHELVMGHLFMDPFTAEPWPRFPTGALARVEVEYTRSGGREWPVLVLGSKGSPRREQAVAVLPMQHEILCPPPTPQQVVRAVMAHDRAARIWGHDGPPESTAAGDELVSRVELIEERGQPVLLATCLFTPVERMPGTPWLAADPFGLGVSTPLRHWIGERVSQEPGLMRCLNELLGQKDDERVTMNEFAARLTEQASLAVRDRLPLLRPGTSLHRGLSQAEEQRLEAEHLERSDPGQRRARQLRREAVVQAQVVLELLCQDLRGRYPAARRWEQLDRDGGRDARRHNAELLDRIAGDLGLRVPLPQALAEVKPGKVQAAAGNQGASLRPLLIVLLLGAQGAQDHPLRRAAAEAPDLLAALDRLASLRDRCAHAAGSGGGEIDPTQQQLAEVLETTYRSVALLGARD